jgi:hypothetical protein
VAHPQAANFHFLDLQASDAGPTDGQGTDGHGAQG